MSQDRCSDRGTSGQRQAAWTARCVRAKRRGWNSQCQVNSKSVRNVSLKPYLLGEENGRRKEQADGVTLTKDGKHVS